MPNVYPKVRNARALTFPGTRGEIEISSRFHRRHSALLVEHDEAHIMIDCGADWLDRTKAMALICVSN